MGLFDIFKKKKADEKTASGNEASFRPQPAANTAQKPVETQPTTQPVINTVFDDIMAPFLSNSGSLFFDPDEYKKKKDALTETFAKGEEGEKYLTDLLLRDAIIANGRYTLPNQGDRVQAAYNNRNMIAQALGDMKTAYTAEILEKILLCTSTDPQFAISLQIACANSLGRTKHYESLEKVIKSGQNVPAVMVARDYLRLRDLGKDEDEINVRDTSGWAPIHKTGAMDPEKTKNYIQDLIDKGADLDIIRADREHTGSTALYSAVLSKQNEVAELLLENGANPNSSDLYGSFPLQRAAAMGNTELIRILLQHGADVRQKTLTGKTALDWALQNHHTDIAEILQSAGA